MIVKNPKRYRERSVPRPVDEAREACAKFMDELDDLVQKHGIADVQLCGSANTTITKDGEVDEVPILFVMHIGNHARALEMAAYAHAFLRAEFDEHVLRFKVHGAKAALKDKGDA